MTLQQGCHTVLAGVRHEDTRNVATLLPGPVQQRHYGAAYPNLQIDHALGEDANLSGQDYRRGISGPGLKDSYQRRVYGRILFLDLVCSLGGEAKDKNQGFAYEQ